jgi:hypothetical protein
MKKLTPEVEISSELKPTLLSRLNQPLSNFWCVFSWLGATAIFFTIADALGGPAEGDVAESVYSTWAFQHGHFACAYPPGSFHASELTNPFALVAPVYPLLSGLIAAIFRIGHAVAFPTSSQLGRNCATTFAPIYHWSVKSGAINQTIRLSFIAWPVLLIGVVMFLRASGRGRSGWEAVAVLVVACSPPVLMPIVDYFHPQDILAVALILIALALTRNRRWFWGGVLIGLAFTTQQFAFLVAAPLLVITPSAERRKLLTGALGVAALIDLPILLLTSGRAFKTIVMGSNRTTSHYRSTGGTVLWEANPRGILLFVVSRLLPIIAAMLLARFAARRLGPRVLDPVPLISLMATAIVLRLVFEINLLNYYFMATTVMLIMLDVTVGRIRGYTIAWIALVTLAFNPVHWGFFNNWTPWDEQLYKGWPVVLFLIALLVVGVDALRRRVHIYRLIWIGFVAITCESRIWGRPVPLWVLPNWLWQIVLVGSALALAVGPLFSILNDRVAPELLEVSQPI